MFGDDMAVSVPLYVPCAGFLLPLLSSEQKVTPSCLLPVVRAKMSEFDPLPGHAHSRRHT